jgi:predicted HicB family RNase H-like nuclease
MVRTMTYKGYAAKIEFDEAGKLLHGEVIGIRDVVTFQADSAADIEKEFHASVDDYLAFCKKRGEPPEKPASGKFVVRVPPELHRRLSIIAELEHTSLNSLVEDALSIEAARRAKKQTA